MRLVSAVMLVVALAACGRTPPSGPDNAGLGAITAIAMQKTPCYGTCAAYTVRLTADGRARYDGLHYAPLQGRFSGKFDFAPLAAWIVTQHPETLTGTYRTAPTDAPGVNLAIDYGARRVTFTNLDEASIPLRLEGILLAVDGATARIRWRRDDAVTAFLGNFTTGAVTLNLDQDSAGTFYGYTIKGEHCADAHGLRIVPERGSMRLRCGTRTSVLRIAGGDLLAAGDAIPPGRYRRISPYAAAVERGWRPEPRATE